MNKKITSLKEKNEKKFEMIQRQYKLVWTDNDIALNLVNPFTARQLKIIDYVITEIDNQQIKSLNRDFVIIKVRNILDFYTNSNSSGNLLKAFENDIVKISNIGGWWRYDPEHPEYRTIFRYFQSVDEIRKGDKSILKISFNKHYLKRLYNSEPRIATDDETGEILLDKNGQPINIGFNKHELLYTKELKSKYSITFYKKCNVWKNSKKGYFIYELKDLRQDFLFLDTPKKTYTYGYISRNAILPAMKEINDKTDIHISSIELLPNRKNVERLKVNLHEKSKEKQERKMQEGEEQIIEKVDKQKEQYHDKLLNQKNKTDVKKAQKRHIKIEKRQSATYFENILKENDEKLKNGEIKIFDLVKEHEERINKIICQYNIDYFVSDNLDKQMYEEISNNKEQDLKENYNLDTKKLKKAQKEEYKELFKDTHLSIYHYQNNYRCGKWTRFIKKYDFVDNRKFDDLKPDFQEQMIEQEEFFNKHILKIEKSREEIIKSIKDTEKEIEKIPNEITEDTFKELKEWEIEHLRELLKQYDEKHKEKSQ